MSRENQQLSYDELMQELAQLCSAESTGTMFIVSDAKHSARIGIQNGEIICFAYRMHKGFDALLELYDMNTGKYHFSNGIFNPYSKLELPETPELLQHFKLKTFPQSAVTESEANLSSTIKVDKPLSSGASSTVPPVASAKTSKPDFPSSQVVTFIDNIEAALTNYLGPFADITIHDYLASHNRPESRLDFKNMINFLTLEIDEVADQEAFKKECSAILR